MVRYKLSQSAQNFKKSTQLRYPRTWISLTLSLNIRPHQSLLLVDHLRSIQHLHKTDKFKFLLVRLYWCVHTKLNQQNFVYYYLFVVSP